MAKATDKKSGAKPKVTVVEAAGAASAARGNAALGTLIQDAMTAETEKCFAEGITDPNEIRERKLAAREDVKARHEKAMERAAADAAKG
jgi:hypothetical protein